MLRKNIQQTVYAKSFLGIIFTTIIIIVIVFVVKASMYKNQLDEIQQMQQDDSRQLEQLITSASTKIQNHRDVQDDIVTAIDIHSSKMQHELELATTNLQSDVELLSLWTSIITIVFLVFSIYSIFKTDEMLTKAKTALDNITEKETQAKALTEQIRNQNNSTLQELSQRIAAIELRATQVNDKLVSIQRQEEQIGSSSDDGAIDATQEESEIDTPSLPPSAAPEPPEPPTPPSPINPEPSNEL